MSLKKEVLMKALIIFLFTLIFPYISAQVYDDVYFKPSDKINVQKVSNEDVKPKYKNGAKQIVYIQKKDLVKNDSTLVEYNSSDSILLSEELLIEDSLLMKNSESGYYLNGFSGTQSDFEYAERIRKFHDPRYTIFISDPRYNDIYFLNSWDWNVYVDGAYAYVTPTWTNPMWFDYYWRPFSYNSWNWHSPYGMYNSYYYDPFYWNMYGGYYGGYYGNYYGGYYSGWGYPYSGYYNNWNYYPYWGYGGYSKNYKDDRHNDAVRRTKSGGASVNSDLTNVATRVSGSYNKSATTRSDLNSNSSSTRLRSNYSGVSRVGGETRTVSSRSSERSRSSVNLDSRTARTNSNDISRQSTAVRSSSTRTNSNPERTYRASSESSNIVRTQRTNSSSTRSYSSSNSTSSSSSSTYRSSSPSTSSSSSYSSGSSSSSSSSSSRSSSSSGGTRSSSGSGSRR